MECIHDTTVDKCNLCNGYVRWMTASEKRFRWAVANPEEARREFWRSRKERR